MSVFPPHGRTISVQKPRGGLYGDQALKEHRTAGLSVDLETRLPDNLLNRS